MKKPAKDSSGQILVNKLTVRDAMHLFHAEGGAFTRSDLVFHLVSTGVVSGFLTRAIYVGQATIWHLCLPMIAEYLAYLVAVPAIHMFVRHPELRKVSWQCLRILAIEAVAIVVAGLIWPLVTGKEMVEQWQEGWAIAWNWIFDSGIHWPILLAAIYSAINVNRSVGKLVQFGPPFMGPGMGCAMRILVFFVAGIAIPVFGMVLGPPRSALKDIHHSLKIGSDSISIVWVVWALLLLSEVFAIWMRWDIQQRLERAGKLPVSSE